MSNQKILKCHCADDCQQLFIDECGRPLRKVTCKFEDCENVLIYAHALKLSKYKCFSHREKFFAEAQRIADEADFSEAQRIAEASDFAEAQRKAADATSTVNQEVVNSTMEIPKLNEYEDWAKIVSEAASFVYQTSSLNTFFSSTRNLLAEALSHDDFKVLAELLACPLSEFLRYSIFILLNISSISNELHIYSVLNI